MTRKTKEAASKLYQPTSEAPSTRPRLGVHVSIAGGLHHAFSHGKALGCESVQIFVKNPRQIRGKPLGDEDVTLFKREKAASGIHPVIAHANYLLNIGSPNPATRELSISALIDELTRCEALEIPWLVLHPGAHLSATMDEGIRLVIQSLDEIHKRCAGFKSRILLEVTAGQGSTIGHRFEHLRDILTGVRRPELLGICLDTCHLFVSGYEFRTHDQYQQMISELDSAIGLALVKCIHMNDSKKELNSRVDRHEHIGKGKIGKEGFRFFLNDARFVDVPMILETPKGKDGRGVDLDKVNLKRLSALLL